MCSSNNESPDCQWEDCILVLFCVSCYWLKTHCWKSAPCDVTTESNSWELYRIYYYSVTNCAILVHLDDNYMRIGSTGPWLYFHNFVLRNWCRCFHLCGLNSCNTVEIKDVFMCSKHHLLLSTLAAVTSKLVINQAIRLHLFLSLSTKLAFWSIVTHNNADRLTDHGKKRSRRMKIHLCWNGDFN